MELFLSEHKVAYNAIYVFLSLIAHLEVLGWLISCKVRRLLTVLCENESVDAAEHVVEDDEDEEVLPDQLIDGSLPADKQLEKESAGRGAGEYLTAVGDCHLFVDWIYVSHTLVQFVQGTLILIKLEDFVCSVASISH